MYIYINIEIDIDISSYSPDDWTQKHRPFFTEWIRGLHP